MLFIIYIKNTSLSISSIQKYIMLIKRTRWLYLIIFVPFVCAHIYYLLIFILTPIEVNLRTVIFFTHVVMIIYFGIRYANYRQDFHVSKDMPYLKETSDSTKVLLYKLRKSRLYFILYLIFGTIIYLIFIELALQGLLV